MISNSSENSYKNYEEKEEDLNIDLFLNFIFRNKIILFIFTFITFIFSFNYAKNQKSIWQGNTEIVLQGDTEKTNFGLNAARSLKIAGVKNFSKQISMELNTSVDILKSPSVLMPIFEFVRNEKKKTNPDYDSNFFGWRNNNLKIALKNGTTILGIKYEDTDKELILPVLEKITATFQEYTEVTRKRNLEISSKYLINQIDFYRKKSAKSIETLEEFAIDQDLAFVTIYPTQNNYDFLNVRPFNPGMLETNLDFLQNNIDIEKIRLTASDNIKNIESKISSINNIDDLTELQFIAISTSSEIAGSELMREIESVDKQLRSFRFRYKEGNQEMKKFEDQKNLLIKLLKQKLVSFLKAEKINQESIMESAMRPKDVLIKYNKLLREAQGDRSTYILLETNLRNLELELSSSTNPWQMISKPTLLTYPVGPYRKRIVLGYAFMGFIIGLIFAAIKDLNSDNLYDLNYLEKILETKVLEKIKLSDNQFLINTKDIFINEILNLNSSNKIQIIKSTSLKNEDIENAIGFLKNKNFNYEIFKSFNELNKELKTLIFININNLKKSEILKLKNRLNLCNVKLNGIILLT